MGQVLQYSLKTPHHPDGMDDHEYMVTLFVDSVRECFKAAGIARKADDIESCGSFLVGYRGKLYHVESDYQVGESVDAYSAVGCGTDLALGSMYTTEWDDRTAESRITIALDAASNFSAGVGGPYHFVSSEDK